MSSATFFVTMEESGIMMENMLVEYILTKRGVRCYETSCCQNIIQTL